MGSRVTFRDDVTAQVRTVVLVDPEEADLSEGRISVLTPVGAALIGLSARSVDRMANRERQPPLFDGDCGRRGELTGAQHNLIAESAPRLRRLRHIPFQSRKPRETAVERDPFAAPLDRKGGVPGICYGRVSRAGRRT